MKKSIKYLGLFALVALSNIALQAVKTDPDLEEFTMIEVTDEPAKKAKMDVEKAKQLILQAQKKLKAVESVAKSDELEQVVNTTKRITNALRKLAFKNGPGFEIANKTNSPIWITVISNGDIITRMKNRNCDKIEGGERFALDLTNLKEDMTIAVYQENPTIVLYAQDKGFYPIPDFVYETTEGARGKTKYFTWNPAKYNAASKYLYPQTGKLAGWAKGSTSGYLLTNNIKQFELSLTQVSEE